MADSSITTGYWMNLGNGLAWSLIPTKDTDAWLREFSSILELRSGIHKSFPMCRFVRAKKGFDRPHAASGLPAAGVSQELVQAGWTYTDLTSIRVWSHPNAQEVMCELGRPGDHTREILMMRDALFVVHREVVRCGGLPLHAALVEKSGMGLAIAGPGGMGKSTLCQSLPSSWNVLCDDESLIVRHDSEGWRAHPVPTWSDRLRGRSQETWNIHRNVHLDAIFFLERADSEEVIPVAPADAAARINLSTSQVYRRNLWDLNPSIRRALRRQLFHNACDMAGETPAFVLKFSRFGKPWVQIEQVLEHVRTVYQAPRLIGQ
jgi:SynChlorMet cassette protein ScmC